MKMTLRMSSLAAFAAMLLLFCGAAMAQDQPGAGGPGAGGPGAGGPGGFGGGRMRMDPAQMQERMLTNIKDQLKATDEEWAALKPLVADVLKNQQTGRGGRGGMMGGMMGGRRRGGNAGGDAAGQPAAAAQPAQPTQTELAALRTALENESTPPAELKAKMEAYRAAVKKQETALKESREKLRAALTPRQEAQLVVMGLLD